MFKLTTHHLSYLFAGVMAVTVAVPSVAADRVTFVVPSAVPDLREALGATSSVAALIRDTPDASGDEILGAALSDYAALTRVLYAEGRYGGTVNILIDGREAADIPLLDTPASIQRVRIVVDPGPLYRFGDVRIGPIHPGTTKAVPQGGAPARATDVRDGLDAVVTGWRTVGHAYAAPAGQDIVADHASDTLDVAVGIDPGPRITFGRYRIATPSMVRESAIRRIAGNPEGLTYSPEIIAEAERRLRRTGAFASVTITEPDAPPQDAVMDPVLRLVDEKPRRFGFGAEVASAEGVTVSAFWLHRNLFGGAERFRAEAEVGDLGGARSGVDYSLTTRLDIPAIYGTDTGGFVMAEAERRNEPTFSTDRVELGFGVNRRLSDRLTSEVALTYLWSQATTPSGTQTFNLVNLPATITYDSRDDALDPTSGFYAQAEVTPFLGLGASASGVRAYGDARAYRALGGSTVVAGRLQFGTVYGPAPQATYPDYLFYSGGGGTVRGQPYQSLFATYANGQTGGGQSFAAASLEVRQSVTDNFQAVGFVDYGFLTASSGFSGASGSHAGAGLGIRYTTPVGPIRFDVATPISGNTGQGLQFYIGIGQAF
ncbi:BamA/TamA family outer membrane protein [Rhodobacteraceae bacterium ASV31]|nr:BamA/TamA family outer membrane protein [Anianabacter salinae]